MKTIITIVLLSAGLIYSQTISDSTQTRKKNQEREQVQNQNPEMKKNQEQIGPKGNPQTDVKENRKKKDVFIDNTKLHNIGEKLIALSNWKIIVLLRDPRGIMCSYKLAGISKKDFRGAKSVLTDLVDFMYFCLLYTSDAADDLRYVDLGGRRSIKKKKKQYRNVKKYNASVSQIH